MSARRLFHLMDWQRWTRFRDGPLDELRPASLAQEGFCHLSLGHQLAGTLQAHFKGAPRLALLELEEESVAPELVFEPSRAGEEFPHLRRAIRRGDLVACWCLESAGGGHLLPEGLGRSPFP